MARNCRLEIGKALQGLTDAEADQIYNDALAILDRANKAGENPVDALNKAVTSYKQKIQTDKAKALLSKQKYQQFGEYLDQDAFKGKGDKGIRAAIIGDETGKYVGIGSNIELQKRNISNKFGSIITQELGQIPGAIKRLQNGTDDVVLRKLLMGETVQADEGLKQMARTIKKVTDMLYEEKRRAGFNIEYLEGRVVRQKHNIQGMRDLGAQNWKKLARDTFDFDAMGLDDAAEIEKYLNNMFEGRTSSEFSNFWSVDDDFRAVTANSPGNRFERKRSVVFKDAEASHAYNQAVNKGETLFQNIAREVDYDSGQIAAAQVFGPNYRSTFNKLVEDVRARDGLSATAEQDLREFFQYAVSPSRRPGDSLLAKFGDKARKLTDMSRLGKALLTTVTDFAYGSNVVSAVTGKNLFQSHNQIVREFFKNIPAGNRQRFGGMLNTFMDDVISQQYTGRLGEAGANTGLFDKAHNLFMKATGLPTQSIAMRQSIAKFTSTAMEEQASKGFGELYSGTVNAFNKFGIGSEDWDIIRKASQEFGDGTRGLTAEGIMRTGAENAAEVADKWSSFLTWTAEQGSPTAGLKRSKWKYTLDPNTVMGQMGLFIGQYKSFTLAMWDTMATISNIGDDKFLNMGRVAATASMATVYGYMSLIAKDFVGGKEDIDIRRDPTKATTWLDAFVQGGSGMIYADFLTAEYDKAYKSLAKDVAGPAFGLFDDAAGLFAAAARGNLTAKKAIDTIERNTPSIPMMKAALNKNVYDALRKALDVKKKTRSDNRFRPQFLE